MIQVCSTAPFYISKTLKQGKKPPDEPLWLLFKKRIKNQGALRGLFFPGLIPRLAQSILIGGPLAVVFEKKPNYSPIGLCRQGDPYLDIYLCSKVASFK